MISSNTITFIHERLCQIADSDEPFGNFNVILCGDFLQLRSVRGHYMFKEEVIWPLFTPRLLSINQQQPGHDRFI